MTALEHLLPSAVVYSIGWALLHSLWQGLLVAAGLVLVLRLLKKKSANVHYAASFGALLLMVLIPLATLMLAYAPAKRAAVSSRLSGSHNDIIPSGWTGESTPPTPIRTDRPTYSTAQPGTALPPLAARPPDGAWRQRLLSALNARLPLIVLAWLCGVAALSVRLFAGWLLTERWRRSGARAVAEHWQETFVRVAQRLRVTRPVRLLESALAEVPTVIGCVRPVILLPAAALTGLTSEQLEAILAHELAHIRRHDYLANLVQNVIETLLFYHPAVWWVSRRVRIERENCCDDLAVAACGNALVYARGLAELEGLRGAPARLALAANGGQLLSRVWRLLGRSNPHSNSPSWSASALVVLAVAAAGVGCSWLACSAHTASPGSQPVAKQTRAYRPIQVNRGSTSTVSGVVVDEDDHPVTNALVVAAQPAEEDEPETRRQVRTDAQGRFVFDALEPEGYWYLSIDDARYAPMWEDEWCLTVPTAASELPLRIRLYAPRALPGVVVDEAGTPVPGTKVTLVREYLPGSDQPVQGWLAYDLQTTQADAQGRFRLERLRPGKIELMLEHDGFARTLPDAVPVEDPARETKVTIERGLTLHGQVVAEGQPRAGVTVQVNGVNLAHRSLGSWRETTNAAGEFTVMHVTGWPREALTHGGHQTVVVALVDDPSWSSPIYQITPIDERTLPRVVIQAERGATDVEGRKLIEVGEIDPAIVEPVRLPMGDSTIEVQVEGYTPSSSSSPAEVHVSKNVQEEKDGVYRSEKISDLGRSVFSNLPAGTYTVSLSQRPSPPSYPPQVVTAAAGGRSTVVLQKGPARLRGTVRAGGKPVTTGNVWIVGGSCRGFLSTISEDGRYELNDLLLGRYEVAVWGGSGYTNCFDVEVTQPDTVFDVNLPSGRIYGRVVGYPGVPAGGFLSIEPRDDDLRNVGNSVGYPVDGGGKFSIEHVPPGTYTVSAPAAGPPPNRLFATTRLENDTSQVEVELRAPAETGAIAGTITRPPPKPGSGSRKEDAYVSAIYKDFLGYGGQSYIARMDATGTKYQLDDLPVGTYGLFFRAYGPVGETFWIPDVEVRAGRLCELDLTVPPEKQVLIILDPADRSTTREVWQIQLPGGLWLHYGQLVGAHSSAPYAPRTRFGLPAGEYTVEGMFVNGSPRVAKKFTVEPGDGLQEVVVRMP